MKPKKKVLLGKNSYFRISPEDWTRIQALAESEGLNASDIVRRAVRSYLSGGVEKWAAEQARSQAVAVREPSPEELAAAWLAELSGPIRRALEQIAQALRRAIEEAQAPSGHRGKGHGKR